MGLKLQVDADGAHLLPFARKKLREMKAWMLDAGLGCFTKHIFADNGAQIRMNSLDIGNGLFLDFIRIIAGQSYLVGVSMPDPTPYRSLFLDTIAGQASIDHYSFEPALSNDSGSDLSLSSVQATTVAGASTFMSGYNSSHTLSQASNPRQETIFVGNQAEV